MGLERIAVFLNGHSSVWQTDELARLLEVVAEPLGVTPSELDETAAVRCASSTDHLRAALAIAAAGIRPSATRQGYILRKLVRRAVRHAELLLGTDQGLGAALGKATANVSDVMGARWPDVGATETGDQARETIAKEADKFAKTLARGVENLHEVAAETERVRRRPGVPPRRRARLPRRAVARGGRRAWASRIAPDWEARYEELREQQRARSRQ